MNYEKVQSDYIRRAAKEKIYCVRLQDGHGILLCDGYAGYVIPNQYCYIDPNKFLCLKANVNYFISINDNDRELKLTNHYIKNRASYIVKATCEEFDVWINEKYLKPFTAPKLYGCGETERVLVVNELTNSPYGIIMPIRMSGEEKHKKAADVREHAAASAEG